MESTGSSTSVRPGAGPAAVESPGSRAEIIQRNSAPVLSAKVENHDHGAKSDARLALLFSGGALALAFVMCIFVFGLYNRHYVLRIYYDDIKAALLQHGVNPHPHLPTESP